MTITREEIEREVKKHKVTSDGWNNCLKFKTESGKRVFSTCTVEEAVDFICACLNLEPMKDKPEPEWRH